MILYQIKDKAKLQIELDQLTGSIAIQLRASIITVEDSERRLRIAHAAMLIGCLYPLSCSAFMKAYKLQEKIENSIQKIAEENWNLQKIKWLTQHPLLGKKSNFPSIIELKQQKELTLKIQFGSLISASKLWQEEGINAHVWKITWIK